jgi:HEAT repeat protein
MIISPSFRPFWSLTLGCLLGVCAARAEDIVDSPMYRDPDLPKPRLVKIFPDRCVPLWLQALERPEADFRTKAALTIAEAREAGMIGLEVTIPALVRELERTDQHPSVRLAVARALVALDAKTAAPALLKACQTHSGEVRAILEPALARWKWAPAEDDWLRRIHQPGQQRDTILAFQGLAALKSEKAIPRLRELALAKEIPAAYRLEAARALGVLRTSGSEADADTLTTDLSRTGLMNRLVAVSLLRHHSSPEAIRRLQTLATDPEPTVAAIAVVRLKELDTKLIVPLLPSVLASPDAPVRAAGVETLFRHPSDSHLKLLGDELSDPHPEVRAQARRALRDLAAQVELKPLVLREGDRALAGRDWRGREQAALLFGELMHKPAAERLVAVLRDARGEAGVAAAWALRQLAVPETFPAILEYVRLYTRPGNNPDRRKISIELLDRQLAQLIQLLGTIRYRAADAVLRPLIPAQAPASYETRAAAAWALGYLHEGQPVPEVVQPLTGRVAAVVPGDVEEPRVRWMCAVALGRMKAADSLPTLEQFYPSKKPALDPVNNACGWAIEQITGRRVPAPEDIIIPQRGWFLVTID